MFVIVYLRNNVGLFSHLDGNIEGEEDDPDLSGEDNKKIQSVFNIYCKDLIDSIGEHIKLHSKVVLVLINLLKVLLIYLILAGLYKYLFVPRLKNSDNCNLNRLYKYGFEYILIPIFLISPLYEVVNILTGGIISFVKLFITATLGDMFNINLFRNDKYNKILYYIIIIGQPGLLLQKNKSVQDILRFNHLGALSKYVRTFLYLFITLLFFIYLFLNIYLTNRLTKNNCYILKNLKKRELLPDKYQQITKENTRRCCYEKFDGSK